MKVIVFGATGSIGKIAVGKLLEEGHEVTAFARSPEKIGFSHNKLTLFKGDAFSAEQVATAILGQDAAVVTLGAGASRKNKIRSEGTLNIIQGMHQHGVKRLVIQSTLGAGETWTNLNFFWKRIMFGLLLKPAFQDHELQEKLVVASGLDWTIVRPSAFEDGAATGKYKVDFAPSLRKLSLKIARSDVAHFLTKQIADHRYINRAVSISN